MKPEDIDLLQRMVESSPAIVLLCIVAITMLWRQLNAKDAALMAIHRETLVALGAVTKAVDELKNALEARR